MSQETLTLAQVDDALSPLLNCLSLALTHRCPVIAHTLWHTVPYTALLPFHIHLRWPGRVEKLPLTMTCTVVPFFHTDVHMVQIPLYQAHEAHNIRLHARAIRYASQSDCDGDFVHPDWEEGFRKHRDWLQERLLPGCSFLSIDVVGQSGQISRGNRPYLGARASRSAPRPHILVPAHGTLSKEAFALLASTDVLLINLQKVRGQSALAGIREILLRRGDKLPSLIISSSPGDLSAIQWHELGLSAIGSVINAAPRLHTVKTTIIGKDRPQAERRFDFAISELRGLSPLVDHLTHLAASAWWAGRQNMMRTERAEGSLYRFSVALEQARREAPSEARLLTAAETLLTETFGDQTLTQERLQAVLEAVFSVPTGKRTLIITKHIYAATHLQSAIAEAASVTKEEVVAAGITCTSSSIATLDTNYEYAIACGYFSMSTLDLLLASGASHFHLILDPVEAGVTWHAVREMERLIQGAKASDAEHVLQRFSSALYSHLLPFVDLVPLTLEETLHSSAYPYEQPTPFERMKNAQENIMVLFVDGTWLELPRTSRVEIIDRQGPVRLRTILSNELQPGDELLLVASDSRALFSEYLLLTLDSGRLQPLVEKRDLWLTVIHTVVTTTQPNIRVIHQKLSQRGVNVSYSTVLSWVRPSAKGEHMIPVRWQHFNFLAEELALTLPAAYLSELFHAIRQLRVRHRLAGRNLVRAMRNAYLGRLDSVTIAQIEREWGLSVRELMQNTRLVEVDSVLLS